MHTVYREKRHLHLRDPSNFTLLRTRGLRKGPLRCEPGTAPHQEHTQTERAKAGESETVCVYVTPTRDVVMTPEARQPDSSPYLCASEHSSLSSMRPAQWGFEYTRPNPGKNESTAVPTPWPPRSFIHLHPPGTTAATSHQLSLFHTHKFRTSVTWATTPSGPGAHGNISLEATLRGPALCHTGQVACSVGISYGWWFVSWLLHF